MANDDAFEDLQGIPRDGDVVAGKFLIRGVLGQGGMGVVVSGDHLQLRQPVAIKFLRPALAKQPEALARFLREARAAAAIKSEHATRILDVGTTDEGAPYMVMERLAGMSLDALIQAKGPQPIAASVAMVLEASEAIAEAHAAGIVHRDLKPANLFVVDRPDGTTSIKVLDFGISKSVLAPHDASLSASLTAPHALLGSPMYMSPEQVRDARSVDLRSDLWALGVILYELLIAEPPFTSESIPHLYALILSAEPTPPRKRRPEIPGALDEIILRCLAKDPTARFPDVGALARALGPFAPEASRPLIARIISAADRAAGRPPSTPPVGRRGLAPPTTTPRAVAVVSVAAASTIVGAGLWLVLQAGERDERTRPDSSATSSSSSRPPPPPAPVESAPAAPPAAAIDAADGLSAGASGPATSSAPVSTPAASARVRDLRGIKLIE